jgi:hypothetical protein
MISGKQHIPWYMLLHDVHLVILGSCYHCLFRQQREWYSKVQCCSKSKVAWSWVCWHFKCAWYSGLIALIYSHLQSTCMPQPMSMLKNWESCLTDWVVIYGQWCSMMTAVRGVRQVAMSETCLMCGHYRFVLTKWVWKCHAALVLGLRIMQRIWSSRVMSIK